MVSDIAHNFLKQCLIENKQEKEMSKTCNVTGHLQAWKQSLKSKWCGLSDVTHDSLMMVVTIGCQWEPLSKTDETIQKN